MDPKTIPILVMGCGGVGRHLLHRIAACRALHRNLGILIRVVAVCDSRSLLTSTAGLTDSFLSDVCRAKSAGSPLPNDPGHCEVFEGPEAKSKLIEIAALLGGSTGLVVVDCTASAGTVDVLKQVVELGCCIVLANKKPLTGDIEDYKKLMSKSRRVRYASTVGAGLPIINAVARRFASGDSISRVIGSLSGTLGYVMSELANGKLFSEVVQRAKHLGYTEPDPREDLNGMDVARKALILARRLGQQINMDDLKIESLYPKELGPDSMSADDFISKGLPSLDKDILERVKVASSNGNVLRYVCTIEGSRCQVGLQELSKDSALGRLRGSDNVVEIYTECYKEAPLVIQGAGAGNDTTSAGVLADIVDLQDFFT